MDEALKTLRTMPDDVRALERKMSYATFGEVSLDSEVVAPENCRNCGAPPVDGKCQYCGTVNRAASALLRWAGLLPFTVSSGVPGSRF